MIGVQGPDRRLRQVAHHLVAPESTAGGIWSRISGLFGGKAEEPAEPMPEVSGIVRACFSPPQKEELEAKKEAGWNWAKDGRFVREQVNAIEVGLEPGGESVPPSHDALYGVSERALLCQTAEGYQKLKSGLPPHTHERLSPSRPGSAENVFLEGIEQWSLCIGDEFEASGKGGPRLQVSSPRRPCERWNEVHGGDATAESNENVRHFCMTNTLGGFFFRVVRAGTLSVGDTLTLVSRPHPSWSCKRLGDLLYSGGGVTPEQWACWRGSAEELAEALALPELATIEWKDVMKDL